MAQATVELRNLMKLPNFNLFDFDYQFDDSQFKQELEQAIISFFFFYEIGSEMPDMFKFKFEARWKRIIPYYNRLYNTTVLKYDPLINNKSVESSTTGTTSTSNSTGTNTTDSDSTNTTNSNNKKSDYPQMAIGQTDYLSGEDEGTATSAGTDKSTATSEVDSSLEQQQNFQRTVESLSGMSYQELILKERSTIINITNMIIEEMKPCFILTY